MRRRVIRPLTPEEHQTLEAMYRYHPQSRLRERAHMVLLSSQGYGVQDIAAITHRCEATVSRWLKAFEADGFLGLYDQPIPGRPGRLSADQLKQLEAWLDDSPRTLGYQQSNWTLRLVQHRLWFRFGVRLSLSRIHQRMHQLGFRRIRYRHRSIVPTEEQIQHAFALIKAWLHRAKAKHVRLFYLDETVAMLWSTLSLGWARKGSRPQVAMADDHRRVGIFAAVDPLTGRVHYRIVDKSVTQQSVIAFLKQVRRQYPGEPLVFLLDNAKPHVAASVKQFVAEDGKMTLVYLPRYTSLYCHPIERLFKRAIVQESDCSSGFVEW